MKKYTAVIPVREVDGKGLRHKDTLPFAGSNLLTHKIRQLKNVPGIEIIVSTDDDTQRGIAEEEGIKVLARPSKYSAEYSLFGEFVKDVCVKIETEHIIWACVTSPFVSADCYIRSIELYEKKLEAGYDSLVTVQRLQRYLMDQNGALNFRPGKCFKSMDQLPELYIFTNGISIAQRKNMMKWKYTSGDMPYMMILNKKESIDICDEFDYECAKRIYESTM